MLPVMPAKDASVNTTPVNMTNVLRYVVEHMMMLYATTFLHDTFYD